MYKCMCVCFFFSQMSLNRTPSALRIPAATGEHLTSSRLLLERCQIKGVCVCVGLRSHVYMCVFQHRYSEPCQIKTTKQTVRVTQTGQVPCTMAVVGRELLCLCLFGG